MAKKQGTEPPDEREILAAELRRIGRKGGQARAKNLTAEERSRIAKTAAAARWSKVSSKK